jgi:hypothetical protein
MRVRSYLAGQFDEIIGSITHRGDNDYYLVAAVKNFADPLGD